MVWCFPRVKSRPSGSAGFRSSSFKTMWTICPLSKVFCCIKEEIMAESKEPRFTNARKRDLGDFVIRQLLLRDSALTPSMVRKVCSHLYTRLRGKEGAEDFRRQMVVAAGMAKPLGER